MIPTMILFGLVFGRWWKVSIPLAGIAWVVLLVATGTELSGSELLGAAALGAINAAVGAVVYLAVASVVGALVRAMRKARARSSDSGF